MGVELRLILLVLFVFISCLETWAFRCPTRTSSNHLVLTLEGLGGETFGSPVHTLASQVNHKGYQVVRFAHAHTPTTMAACVRRWLTHTPSGKVSIMGHGFGGHTSFQLARVLRDQGINVEFLVLFDARDGREEDGCRRDAPRYKKPINVKFVFNYYQCGVLSGRIIQKSKGVYNYQIDTSHVLLPRSRQVVRFTDKILNHDVLVFRSKSMISFTKHFLFGPTLSEVGEISQREALGLVTPVTKQIRAPASHQGEIPKARCTQFGVSYDCPSHQADDTRRWIRGSGS